VGVSYGCGLGCCLYCLAYGLHMVSTSCISLLDQSISAVNIVQPDGVGFVGIGDDNYMGIWCISELEGLLEALVGDLRVWDIISKAWPRP